MRILHVNDPAAVAGTLAKYQRMLGNDVLVVNRDGYDGLGQKQFYGTRIVGLRRRRFRRFGLLQKPLRLAHRTLSVAVFYLDVALLARKFDVVHIHSQYLVSLFLPFKPKIIEFHGDDIRPAPTKRWWIDQKVTGLFLWANRHKTFYVSTPDMLGYLEHPVYIPNPVDTEFFKRSKPFGVGSAVYFHNWHEHDYGRALQLARQNGWGLEIVDRTILGRPVRYGDMAEFIGSKEFLIDRCNIKSLSKTALEALAMGLKVVDYRDKVVEGLPLEHDPFRVAKFTVQIYNEVIQK